MLLHHSRNRSTQRLHGLLCQGILDAFFHGPKQKLRPLLYPHCVRGSVPSILQKVRRLDASVFSVSAVQSPEEFLRQEFVGGGATAVFVVVDDWLAEARGFGQARAAGNDRFKHLITKMFAYFADDLDALETLATTEFPRAMDFVRPGFDE